MRYKLHLLGPLAVALFVTGGFNNETFAQWPTTKWQVPGHGPGAQGPAALGDCNENAVAGAETFQESEVPA